MADQQMNKCNKCKKLKSIDFFKMKKNGNYQKQCNHCLEIAKAGRERNKCIHNRQRADCLDCDGDGICKHRKLRRQCIKCGGSCICRHKKQRNSCKQCSDPVQITIKNMIGHSRHTDKKYHRYDPVKFIDPSFIQGLFEDYKKCYWCKVEMQCITYGKTLTTIERLNNKLGHNRDNCVLACLDCNNKRISNK